MWLIVLHSSLRTTNIWNRLDKLFFFKSVRSLLSTAARCRLCELPGRSPTLPAGQRWAVPMRVTPATIRPRQGVRCQSWCLEWDTASGPTLSVLLGTPKWKTSRARPAPGARVAARTSHASDGPWTRLWFGPRMSARDWLSKTRTCTTRSWAKCWVSSSK